MEAKIVGRAAERAMISRLASRRAPPRGTCGTDATQPIDPRDSGMLMERRFFSLSSAFHSAETAILVTASMQMKAPVPRAYVQPGRGACPLLRAAPWSP